MKTPNRFSSRRAKIMAKLEKIEGVYACKELQIWELAKSKFILSYMFFREICWKCIFNSW